jgi:hypothetical protein
MERRLAKVEKLRGEAEGRLEAMASPQTMSEA